MGRPSECPTPANQRHEQNAGSQRHRRPKARLKGWTSVPRSWKRAFRGENG
ncbi:hypothetical protein ACFFX0_05080 [Citricoccus parietis]|uniref:Uncharacterized protein n=1 Tax=Citricoccus parietis TaxID=592307 RepID=A0ABV5FVC0_9MICC